jgi:hypothetical protein
MLQDVRQLYSTMSCAPVKSAIFRVDLLPFRYPLLLELLFPGPGSSYGLSRSVPVNPSIVQVNIVRPGLLLGSSVLAGFSLLSSPVRHLHSSVL